MKPTLRDTLPHKETPFLRILHILVAVLVLAQIINSNFTESEALHESGLNGIVTWIHVNLRIWFNFLWHCHDGMDVNPARI